MFKEADLRVGEIIEAKPLEGSDKLYIEKIKFDNDEVRTILSGLQPYVPLDQMKGKCIVFYNLKPRPIAGVPSEGMVMCVSNSDRSQINILRPCDDVPLGTRVNILEQEQELTKVDFINPKNLKKFLDLLTTNEEGDAQYDKNTLSCLGKKLVKNLPNGTIS